MRISDWSSDVCSSDLPPAFAIVAQVAPVERRSADAELHFPAFAGDLHIARIEIVAPGIIVSRLLAAELAGLLKFPCHRFVSFLSPPAPRRRLHAPNRGRGCARAAAAIVPPGRASVRASLPGPFRQIGRAHV